jgi:5-methylcytosine-specific restriction protein B
MGRLNGAEEIYKTAAAWRDNCLIGGKSLLWPEDDLWTAGNLAEFKKLFIDKPDTSPDKNFDTKFREQLASGDADVTRLACELLLIYFLFPDSVRRVTKVGLICRVASWKGIKIDEGLHALAYLNDGIGNPGQTYNTSRPTELTYLARFALNVAGRAEADRKALLHDRAATQAVLDKLAKDHREEFGRPPQSWHTLLYLLFPDDYERIASEGHKARICAAFEELLEADASETTTDDRLRAIRRKLEALLGKRELDFYRPPLRACWYTDSDGDAITALPGLQIKRQIVLHGPPGTGKTFQARETLSSSLIRQGLLKKWGPKKYSAPTRSGAMRGRTYAVINFPHRVCSARNASRRTASKVAPTSVERSLVPRRARPQAPGRDRQIDSARSYRQEPVSECQLAVCSKDESARFP